MNKTARITKATAICWLLMFLGSAVAAEADQPLWDDVLVGIRSA